MPKIRIRLAVFFCFLSITGLARAEGFALYEYSARGVALGGTLVARKPDASAVAYNPALMTRLSGIHLMGGASSISPDGKMLSTDPGGNRTTTSLKPSTWIIPHFYYTQQLNDRFTLGVGEFSRFGLGFEYPHGWPGRFNIYEVSLTTASLNPSLAWAATDRLSLAAGLEVMYVSLDLKKRTRATPDGRFENPAYFEVDSNIRNAEACGVGFNLAGHYQFGEQWAAGLHYRSQVEVRAYGDVEYSYLPGTIPAGLAMTGYRDAFHDGEAHATVILPDSIAGGIAWTPTPRFSLEAGATWTRWSTFRGLNIHLPEPVGKNNNPKHWKDVWRFSLGAEYEALDWLILRAGYVYDQSPMTGRYADYLVPSKDRHIYSLGAGFKWEAWTLDLAYAYIQPKNRSYRYSPDDTHVLDSRTRDTSTNVFSLSLGYQF